MSATFFEATATTVGVELGSERREDRALVVRHRVFTDIVRCQDDRVAGVNRPDMDLDIDTDTMCGPVSGRFVLRPDRVDGHWEGEVKGDLKGGVVTACGLGSGRGALAGAPIRVDFQQVEKLDDPPETDDPLAFYTMSGMIVSPP